MTQSNPKKSPGEVSDFRNGEVSSNEADYCKLGIDDFVSGKAINFSIFVKLAEGKFVRIAHQGEDVTSDRIQTYREKGIKVLYLTKEDFRKYLQMNMVLTKAVMSSSAIDGRRKLELCKHANETMLEHLFHSNLDRAAFDQAQTIVESTLNILLEQKDTSYLLDILNRHNEALYAHSVGVCLYAILIAKSLKWDSPQTLFKLAIAGLLHDVGMKEIDRRILNKKRAEWTVDEMKMFESHPERGVEILGQIRELTPDVLNVVLQHHETCTGTGYPSRLNRTKIQPWSRLVAVCDKFCELAISRHDHVKMEPQEAMERIFTLYKDQLDPAFFIPLAEILKVELPNWLDVRIPNLKTG